MEQTTHKPSSETHPEDMKQHLHLFGVHTESRDNHPGGVNLLSVPPWQRFLKGECAGEAAEKATRAHKLRHLTEK